MQDKLKDRLNYAPKEAIQIIDLYLPHPYNCLGCCNTQSEETEDLSATGIDSLRKLRQEFSNLIVPVHLKNSFFRDNGDRNKAVSFNISKTITILESAKDSRQYPDLPENCCIALNQLKIDCERVSESATSPLLNASERQDESYQAF